MENNKKNWFNFNSIFKSNETFTKSDVALEVKKALDTYVKEQDTITKNATLNTEVKGVNANSWFSPSQPLKPAQIGEMEARSYDYDMAQNINFTPRNGEMITYDQLKVFADMCDIVRIIIEKRKDQVSRFKYRFVVKDDVAKVQNKETKRVAEFFKYPDGSNNFDEWIRMLLEQLLVTDSVCIEPIKTLGGSYTALEVIDGTTIKVLINELGRIPLEEDSVAYQQVIKGLIKNDFTYDGLVFRPRNKRVHKNYGFSPVEQIIRTLNIQLRKQNEQLSYYTQGNLPNMLFTSPSEWQPDQIEQFNAIWDDRMNGTMKHKAAMLPPGVSVINTKPEPLKDEFDDWIARIVCFAFSIAPTPFIKENNKATAQTSKQQAEEDGLQGILNWIRNLLNYIINKYISKNVEFEWEIEDVTEPFVKAQIDVLYAQAGILTVDEIRASNGLDPLTDEQKKSIKENASIVPKEDSKPEGAGSATSQNKPQAIK